MRVASAARMGRASDGLQRLGRRQIEAVQQEKLARLVEHAALHAPWHAERLGRYVGVGAPDLKALPIMDKAAMMANFDRCLTDARINLRLIESHAAGVRGDDVLLGRYRVITSGGTSGLKAYYVLDEEAWVASMSAYPQMASMIGFTPRWPRLKLAQVAAGGALHATYRLALSADIGQYRWLRLAVTAPIEETVGRLNEYQPDVLMAYPSAAGILADAQLSGALNIRPRCVVTASEQLTGQVRAGVREAWGVEVHDVLGTSETAGVAAIECSAHEGMHIREDAMILEVVDEHDEPVPDGVMGDAILVTYLAGRVQPIIRYRIDDMVAVTSEPCRCGRNTRRIVAISGRTDDVVSLPAARGGEVRVHPNVFAEAIENASGVVQYQVRVAKGNVHIDIVLRHGCGDEPLARIAAEVNAGLAQLGVLDPGVAVQQVPAIQRELGAGAKARLVKATQDVGTAPRQPARA